MVMMGLRSITKEASIPRSYIWIFKNYYFGRIGETEEKGMFVDRVCPLTNVSVDWKLRLIHSESG